LLSGNGDFAAYIGLRYNARVAEAIRLLLYGDPAFAAEGLVFWEEKEVMVG